MKNFLFLILAFALSSCSYSHISGGTPPSTPTGFTGGGDGEEPVVRFADVNAVLFSAPCDGCKKTCAECHQAKGEDLSFADYANTKQFISELQDRVFVEKDMPPRGTLSDVQLQVLRTWIDNGAPE